ncbi:MAG: hypothetical protein JNL67_13835 [Planctomycetaceae bacterium]|nr:hypothetical protein [Planctomycetaceae bacterium]
MAHRVRLRRFERHGCETRDPNAQRAWAWRCSFGDLDDSGDDGDVLWPLSISKDLPLAKELASLEYQELRKLGKECRDAIGEICDSVASAQDVQRMIQQMLGQPDLMVAFLELRKSAPETAAQLFTAGFSVLINSQTAIALDRELLKRSAANN